MFLTPTDDKLNIKQKTVGSDYVQNMTVKVPLRQISLTLTWKFGNTKKQFQKVKSNIKMISRKKAGHSDRWNEQPVGRQITGHNQ